MKKVVLLAFVLVVLSTAVFVGFIRPVVAQGTIYIRADGSVEGTDKIHRDGNVYTLTDNIVNQSIVVERDNIVIDGAGYTVQGAESGNGITLQGRINVTIRNAVIRGFASGIWLFFSNRSTLYGNRIEDAPSGLGISISDSEHNKILNNTLSSRDHSICLGHSCYNIIAGNNASNNHEGISLGNFSNNNTIANNTANNNSGDGILLSDYCSNNVVNDNVFGYNGQTGIMIAPYSCGNVIRGNTLVGNNYGIGFWGSSSSNTIYHNNFISNTNQASSSADSVNVWDDGYPSGGSYWSDYAGVDLYSGPYQDVTGGDGIGDTPYEIDENNRDNYPLMNPYDPLIMKFRVLYYELLEKYNELINNYNALNSTYYTLLSNYSELQGNYNSLQTSYDNLQASYDHLNSSYNTLQDSYDELQSDQEAITNELSTIRNLMYIFIATTIILIATTIYLAIIKPKVKPESKAT